MTIQTRQVGDAYLVECVVSGVQASRLFVRDRRTHIGTAVLRMGGIADVETDEHYRRRGYARHVLDGAMALMQDKRYDISTLFGISDFYPRWGYAPVFPETRVFVSAKDAAAVNATYRLRRLTRNELPATLELYRRNNAARTGAIVRQRSMWSGFRHGSRHKWPTNVYGAFDGRGRLTGYVVLDKSPAEAIIVEVGYRREDVFGTLLAAGVRQARRVKAEQIHLLAPADHPFVEFCQQFGCRVVIQYHRSGGAMGRIINLEGCFSRLVPELTRRLRRVGTRHAVPVRSSGRLRVATDIGEVVLRIARDAVSVTESSSATDARLDITQAALSQLLFGYRAASAMVQSKQASLCGAPTELLDVLFPRVSAYVWHPDYF